MIELILLVVGGLIILRIGIGIVQTIAGDGQSLGSGIPVQQSSVGRYDPYVPEERHSKTLTADEVVHCKAMDARLGITGRRYAETYTGEYLPMTDKQYRALYAERDRRERYAEDPDVVEGEWHEE